MLLYASVGKVKIIHSDLEFDRTTGQLSPVHSGGYSRRIRRLVVEIGDYSRQCKQGFRLSLLWTHWIASHVKSSCNFRFLFHRPMLIWSYSILGWASKGFGGCFNRFP